MIKSLTFISQVGAFYHRRTKSNWERISSHPWYSTHHRGAQPFHCNETFPENQRAYRTRLDRVAERTYLSKLMAFHEIHFDSSSFFSKLFLS